MTISPGGVVVIEQIMNHVCIAPLRTSDLINYIDQKAGTYQWQAPYKQKRYV